MSPKKTLESQTGVLMVPRGHMRENLDMTDVDPGPVVQRMLLGAELREVREANKLSTADANKALGWYPGKLSKVEQGDLRVTDKDLATVLQVYAVPDDQATRLQQLATDSRRKLPPTRVPAWAAKYVALERAARELKIFYSDSVPGGVQTARYARAMLTASVVVSAAEVDRMAEERAQRAERLLSEDGPRVWLVIGEEALHREIGGPQVLREQLQQLMKLANRPNASVQVVPFDGGAHASHGVPFIIVNLTESRPGIIYVETLSGSDYLGGEHVGIYNLAFDSLRGAALSPQRSAALIDQRLHQVGG